MKSFSLSGNKRELSGKSGLRGLRDQGYIPCELYGKSGNVHFYAYVSDFKDLIYTPETYKVELDIEGQSYNAIVKETQFHPLNEEILHVDFYEIDESKPLTVELPIRFNGTAQGAREGGKFVKKLRKLKVMAKAAEMPEAIEVDITSLGLGKSIKVRDIAPQGVTIKNAGAIPVATVEIPRGLRGKQDDK